MLSLQLKLRVRELPANERRHIPGAKLGKLVEQLTEGLPFALAELRESIVWLEPAFRA